MLLLCRRIVERVRTGPSTRCAPSSSRPRRSSPSATLSRHNKPTTLRLPRPCRASDRSPLETFIADTRTAPSRRTSRKPRRPPRPTSDRLAHRDPSPVVLTPPNDDDRASCTGSVSPLEPQCNDLPTCLRPNTALRLPASFDPRRQRLARLDTLATSAGAFHDGLPFINGRSPYRYAPRGAPYSVFPSLARGSWLTSRSSIARTVTTTCLPLSASPAPPSEDVDEQGECLPRTEWRPA
jgi:hypothetical protein